MLACVRAFGRWASVAADSVWVLGPSVSAVLPLMLGLALTSCEPGTGSPPRTADASGASRPFAAAGLDTAAIADTLRALVEDAYDFSRPGVVERLMSLYPDSGPVISAAAGRVTTSRDSLRAQLEWFWNYVGQNMQDPRWEWTASHVRVLGPDAAVLTASYRVPHRTPEGRPHTVGGAWTMVFERRDGRWVIVQEHLSDLPPEQQRSGQ